MVELFFPKEHGHVVLELVPYCCHNFWMSQRVSDAYKMYKVFYPTLYASESENKDAKLFNCVQRGHQNSLEMMPTLFMLMVVGGIRHPLGCAAFRALYIVSKFFHFWDYVTGDPQNRLEFV